MRLRYLHCQTEFILLGNGDRQRRLSGGDVTTDAVESLFEGTRVSTGE